MGIPNRADPPNEGARVEFLTTHVFGPERVERLRACLAEIGPDADNAHAEVERLRSDLDGIKKRIRRMVTNLEAQEPSSEIADDIRFRLEELGTLRAKKLQRLDRQRCLSFRI
jgi:hypothetical protein